MPLELSYSDVIDAYGKFKMRAYAGGIKYTKTPHGTLLFTTKRGNWAFRDEFAGDCLFQGAEQMSWVSGNHVGIPVVGMVYRGQIRALPPGMTKEDVYGFLRTALSAAPKNQPFRGPLTREFEPNGYIDPPFVHERFPDLFYRNAVVWEEKLFGHDRVNIGGSEIIGHKISGGYTNIYIGWWHFGLLLENFNDIILK